MSCKKELDEIKKLKKQIENMKQKKTQKKCPKGERRIEGVCKPANIKLVKRTAVPVENKKVLKKSKEESTKVRTSLAARFGSQAKASAEEKKKQAALCITSSTLLK